MVVIKTFTITGTEKPQYEGISTKPLRGIVPSPIGTNINVSNLVLVNFLSILVYERLDSRKCGILSSI